MGFGGVPLKQHIDENARKLVKTGPKNGPDFFTHAHIICYFFENRVYVKIDKSKLLQTFVRHEGDHNT